MLAEGNNPSNHTKYYHFANVLGVTASLKEMIVVNHDLVYFDEIGVSISTGLICNGIASDICCHDDDPVGDGGEDGSESNGLGSWVHPDGSYIRYDCNSCTGVEEDTFQVHRTESTTILYRNEDATMKLLSGIYKCDIPLNTSAEDVLTHSVGIYERGMGKPIYTPHSMHTSHTDCYFQVT